MARSWVYIGLYVAVGLIAWFVYQEYVAGDATVTSAHTPSGQQAHGNHIHRWRDERGQWVYGDKPPLAGDTEVETVDYTEELELLRSLPPEALPEGIQFRAQAREGSLLDGLPGLDMIRQLFNDAEGLQQKLDERARRQQEAIDGQSN